MSFVFYDTETTGTKTSFDQILQFAAVKTDDNLNELESFEVRCRLLPHVVPAPGALLTNGLSPEMLIDESLPTHYRAIRRIREKLSSWSPAAFVGFNSISFDEELLRQSFFQTLHGPYLTNTGGNRRADVMRLAFAANILAPGSIVIPKLDNKDTFKLAMLAPANGYAHNEAHEAKADVKATIHIAKLIRSVTPEIWKMMENFSRKSAVIDFVESRSAFLLSDWYGKPFSYIVVPCGSNPKNPGQMVVFDLAYDPDVFKDRSVADLVKVMNSNNKAVRTFRANAQPILTDLESSPEHMLSSKISKSERERRAKAVDDDEEFRKKLCKAAELRFADEEKSPHIEDKIYDGFANADEPHMEKFHGVDWEERCTMLDGFGDERVKEFAHRLVYFEQPDALTAEKRAKLKAWMIEKISTTEKVPWMTIPKALQEADKKLAADTGENTKALNDIKKFLVDYPNRIK